MSNRVVFGLLFGLVLAARLTHRSLVWVEEAYPAAAALQLIQGSELYRDLWFDKPPLSACIYLLWGAHAGWLLRLAGAVFVTLSAWLLYKLGTSLWGAREGLTAAVLLAFYLTFGIPSAVMALAPDLLMLAPHIAAVWLIAAGRPFWSGLACGIAFLINTKALYVLALCLLWNPAAVLAIALGFALPVGASLGYLALQGSLAAYWMQVWDWGFLYSRESFVQNPVTEGLRRTLNWTWFHATAAIGTGIFLAKWRKDARAIRLGLWLLLSAAAVALGSRFFPRYYFQLLPAVTLLGARGLFLLPHRLRIAVLALLLIPVARFGPRYVQLAAGDMNWSDLAMSQDSAEAARIILQHASPEDTLLVWGYRPDVFVLTRLRAGTRFLDSQPLTGVIADRHLVNSEPSAPDLAAKHRKELQATEPTWIVDGLAAFNPDLAITRYEDLREWLNRYSVVARTRGSIIYQRRITAPSSMPAASRETQ